MIGWFADRKGLTLALAAAGAAAAGLVQVYPDTAEAAPLVLSRTPQPPTFWTDTSRGTAYHRLHPLEGLPVIVALLLFYARLDRLDRGERP